MNDLITTHFYLAEIDFNTAPVAGDKIYFKDFPTLTPRDGKTKILTIAVDAWPQEVLLNSPNNIPSIPIAQAVGCTLTLAVESNEYVYNMPVSNLVNAYSGGFVRRFNALPVNLAKSYVTVTQNALIAANTSLSFGFYYWIKKLR